MAASALCVRPADCLGGNQFFGAHRGVRAAPAPRRTVPQQQQHVQVATTASTTSVPARGRANGRKRGRRSPRATGSPAAQKRVMENVVILKRGEQNQQAKVTAAPELVVPQAAAKSGAQAEKAKTVVAADQHSPQVEKGEPVAAAKQGGAHVENVEPTAAAADTQAKKAEQQRGAAATNATKAKVVDRHVPQAKGKDDKNVAAAKQSGGQGMKAGAAPPALYSGPSFAAAPEPRMLPIPLLLLKGRGARLRPRDAERAAPT